MAEAASDPRRGDLVAHALRLEGLTIAWNVLEAAIAISAGVLAGSIALVGFGLDSVIETIAASALFHRLSAEKRGASSEDIERYERRALRIVGITFLALAAYILYEAGTTLWAHETPAPSTIGTRARDTVAYHHAHSCLREAPRGSEAGEPCPHWRCEGDLRLLLPVALTPARARCECTLGLVVGRPGSSASHASLGRQRRRRGPRRRLR